MFSCSLTVKREMLVAVRRPLRVMIPLSGLM